MSRLLPLLPALALALSVAACKPADPHADDPDRVDRRITSAEGDVGVVVRGNDAFAWDLYGELATDDENLFFSPFSISAALGMTYAGTAGTTRDALGTGLHVDLDDAEWHAAFGDLVDDLNGDKVRGYRLAVANRLFGETGYPWKQDFLDTCSEDWNAPLQEVAFSSDPETGRQIVNDWVADQTQDRIPELIPPGVISSDTRMVLANAIYFKGDWWTQFDEAETTRADFTRLDGSTVQVDMMKLDTEGNEDARIRSTWIPDLAVVARLPYEDDEVSAYVIVPDEVDGLPDLEAQLDAESFRDWIDPIDEPGEGNDGIMVEIPRFELRWSGSLVPALTNLGMGELFDPQTCDLTGMAEGSAGEDLVVADVIHEAWVRVDEEGTKAAAATAVVVNDTSAPMPVRADHPFLFVVRDDLTGSLLFVARVMDPTAG